MPIKSNNLLMRGIIKINACSFIVSESVGASSYTRPVSSRRLANERVYAPMTPDNCASLVLRASGWLVDIHLTFHDVTRRALTKEDHNLHTLFSPPTTPYKGLRLATLHSELSRNKLFYLPSSGRFQNIVKTSGIQCMESFFAIMYYLTVVFCNFQDRSMLPTFVVLLATLTRVTSSITSTESHQLTSRVTDKSSWFRRQKSSHVVHVSSDVTTCLNHKNNLLGDVY